MPIDRRSFLIAAGFAASAAVTGKSGAARAAGLAAAFSSHAGDDAPDVDHGQWTELLQSYLKMGPDGVARLDYKAFKAAGRPRLAAYLNRLQSIDVAALSRAGQIAYWSNLYNAKTVDVVLAHYPVRSIKDIDLGGSLLSAFTGGPWSAKVLRAGSRELSLDDIEHEIVRPVFAEPRIHYVLNCASIGCPNLHPAALTAATLATSLDKAARAYVNHPRGVAVRAEGVVVSRIYDWFAKDFGGSVPNVLRHLRRYAGDDLRASLADVTSIAGYEYDWSLNDV
jgi:hypothetical protein